MTTPLEWVGAAAGAATSVLRPRRRPPPFSATLRDRPLLIAHRGGSGLAPENTLPAFRQAVEAWAADAIELDVHATADGRCVVIHDPTLERTTDGTGRVGEFTLEELRTFDAGYRFSPDGGRTFPFRGKGVHVPTIEEVFDAVGQTPLIVELKDAAAQAPLFDAIRRFGAEQRVVAAGQSDSLRTRIGSYSGPISASAEQLRRFAILERLRLARFWDHAFDVVQIPETWDGRRVLTPRLLEALHGRDVPVHIWTVNDAGDMQRLLEMGVDGILTDRPDRLARVLVEYWGRTPPPGLESPPGR